MGTDVLVLGAGIVGVSTALALQQRGHAVMLVDRRPAGQETSYGNAGILQREAVEPYAFPREWSTLARIARGRSNDVHLHWGALGRLAPALLRYWWASSPQRYGATVRAWSRLIEPCLREHAGWIELAGAGDLIHRHGWQRIYRSGPVFDEAAAAASALAQRHGLACTLLDGAALAGTEPALQARLAGAVRYEEPWTVLDPGDLVARYAALFEHRGGAFVQADAMTLRPQGGGWTVDAADRTRLEARHAVIALGPWADGLARSLGYRLPLFVKRGYHRHYAGHAGLRLSTLDVERGVMLAPMTRGLRLTTGAEFARLDAAPTPVQLSRAERSTRELLALGAPVEATPWLGARPCTADMLPVLGAAPRHPGLWFNFGHAHQGLTLGPVTGRLVAELISGEPPFIDPTPYSADRFR